MLDLVLAYIHHVAVFALVGVVAAEYAAITPGLGGRRLRLVAVLDGIYGGLAAVILVAGFARVIWGEAGWQFYVFNWVFWTKIALFAAVGAISIRPTISILRWRRAAAADAAFIAPAEAVAGVRRDFVAEFVLLAFIPIFAATMARGIGL